MDRITLSAPSGNTLAAPSGQVSGPSGSTLAAPSEHTSRKRQLLVDDDGFTMIQKKKKQIGSPTNTNLSAEHFSKFKIIASDSQIGYRMLKNFENQHSNIRLQAKPNPLDSLLAPEGHVTLVFSALRAPMSQRVSSVDPVHLGSRGMGRHARVPL